MTGVAKGILGAGLVVAAAGLSPAARAADITVPNGSFENPFVPVAPPFATSTIDVWKKAPVPQWWLDAQFTAEQWRDSAGIFANVDPANNTPIDNAHPTGQPNQIGFMFSPPGYELFQELTTDVYQVGQAYQATIGVQGGGFGMPLGVPLELRLYYVDTGGNRVPIASVAAPNTNPSSDQSHLTDYTLTTPLVTATDAWAGKPIGIQIYSAATPENSGGYWVFDNVRLASVPEPASLSALGLAAAGLLARRRRA